MKTITVTVYQDDVYDEVAKATDYTGSKLEEAGDAGARDRILAADDDLACLGRFWEEAACAINEHIKEMLVSGTTESLPATGNRRKAYVAEIEVSKDFNKNLTRTLQSIVRSFFISFVTGNWFRYANKADAAECFADAAELLAGATRLIYSRNRPSPPVTKTDHVNPDIPQLI